MIGWCTTSIRSITFGRSSLDFLVMFMQAGFMLRRNRSMPREERCSHLGDEPDDLSARLHLAFWVYGFAIGWGNWWNGPVAPGWYPSLGPGLSMLNGGWGLGAAVDAAGKATGAFTYGLDRHEGLVSNRCR